MNSPEIHQLETENKGLAYTAEFKDFIHQNPGVIKSFNDLRGQLDDMPIEDVKNGYFFQNNDLAATIVKAYIWAGQRFYYFKVEIGSQSFFVKSEGIPRRGKGYEEFSNLAKIKERIKDLPWAEVVDFQLGYQDNKSRSYFVSKWLNLPRLVEYMKTLSSKKDSDEVSEIMKKEWDLQRLLPEFHDVMPYNMFYDPKKKKIYLFDVFINDQSIYDPNLS